MTKREITRLMRDCGITEAGRPLVVATVEFVASLLTNDIDPWGLSDVVTRVVRDRCAAETIRRQRRERKG
jgi:hypothetical protein